MTKESTQVADVDRSLYDFTKSEEGYERYADGLTPDCLLYTSRAHETS